MKIGQTVGNGTLAVPCDIEWGRFQPMYVIEKSVLIRDYGYR